MKAAARATQSAGAKAKTKPAVPEKVEAKAETAVPVKAEVAPVEEKAKAAPVEKAIAKKAASETAVKKAAAPEETVKKEATPRTGAKKETAPETTKKETVKKIPARKATEPEADVHFQFDGKDLVAKDALDQTVKAFKKAHGDVEIRTINLYVVANEGVAYYVVNDEDGDDYKMIL